MPTLLVIGAGLFGSQAAAYARGRGIETRVFDPAVDGAASPASAGLFKESWAGKKWHAHYHSALPLLERLYGVRHVSLTRDDGSKEGLLFVPPSVILERNPVRQRVTAVGDGWLETGNGRHEGWVYIAAGVWSGQFVPHLQVNGKSGSSFLFQGEREGRIRQIGPSRQALAFVRDPGTTYFTDGTAEQIYTPEHDGRSLERAAELGLTERPIARCWGRRPYVPGGPVFQRIGSRTWLATGGRKMGTILGACFARRLVEEELRS